MGELLSFPLKALHGWKDRPAGSAAVPHPFCAARRPAGLIWMRVRNAGGRHAAVQGCLLRKQQDPPASGCFRAGSANECAATKAMIRANGRPPRMSLSMPAAAGNWNVIHGKRPGAIRAMVLTGTPVRPGIFRIVILFGWLPIASPRLQIFIRSRIVPGTRGGDFRMGPTGFAPGSAARRPARGNPIAGLINADASGWIPSGGVLAGLR